MAKGNGTTHIAHKDLPGTGDGSGSVTHIGKGKK